GADHAVLVLWRGFEVADSIFFPEADGVIDVPCAVHWVTFHVTDADGGPLPSVQLAAMDEANLGVVGFGTTDASGDLALRLPDTTYRVEIYWRNTMVLREDGLVLDGQDLDKSLACRVFQATVEVVDRNGASLSDVPVVIKDGTGAVVGTAITDSKGLVVFQVGGDVYNATAHLQTTYRWTSIDMEETTALDVNGSTTYTVKFDEYPPGVIGTIEFWTIVGVVLMFLVMMYLVLLLRRSDTTPPKEPPRDAEEDEGEPDQDDEDGSPTGIDVETYSSADLLRED
ncbi:MAG: carboxypeptidase regulatory-like domain-containing protein, partial [Thermoplasmata archaeon]|nr:carboxypeptidase regulatory-like domain-containing protein [Thermoplasmata archaeon]